MDDDSGDQEITVSIEGLEDWMTFDQANNSVSFQGVVSTMAGNYTLTAQLVDYLGAVANYEFNFEIKADETVEETLEEDSSGDEVGMSFGEALIAETQIEVEEEPEPLFIIELE